jgi:N-acetylglutamate synthase-like GNAT family acetyltransferase
MPSSSPLTFFAFTPQLAPFFESINRQWIEQMFVLEPVDAKVLMEPQKNIINKGGDIWFASSAELGVIGTCALDKKAQGVFELTKMAVTRSARGLKVGEQLLQYVLAQPPCKNAETLFLLTNAKCEAAIHLYEKNGFVHDKTILRDYGANYQRCNVAMKYQGPGLKD